MFIQQNRFRFSARSLYNTGKVYYYSSLANTMSTHAASSTSSSPTSPLSIMIPVVPPPTSFPSCTLHAYKYLPPSLTPATPIFICVHGGDRQLQNAEHFKRHYSFLASLGEMKQENKRGGTQTEIGIGIGTEEGEREVSVEEGVGSSGYYSVSLPGHGLSLPPPTDQSFPSMNIPIHTQSLISLLEQEKELKESNNIVFIGRSYGGAVVQSLLDTLSSNKQYNYNLKDKFKSIIFIAPAIPPSAFIPSLFSGIRLLFCWAKEDPIVPIDRFYEIEQIIDQYNNDKSHHKNIQIDYTIHTFDHILTNEMKEKKQLFWAHLPENATEEGGEEWRQTVKQWIKGQL